MEGSLTELFLGITAVSLLPHAIIGGVQKIGAPEWQIGTNLHTPGVHIQAAVEA